MTSRSFAIIADKNAKETELNHAIQKLGPVTESPDFWSGIANSSEYNKAHRRLCIFQLFQRHVLIGMKLPELGAVLNAPTWLRNRDISIVDELSGKIPVKWLLGETVFILHVFPESLNQSRWAIYLRISGKVGRESFIQLLRTKHAYQNNNNTVILEIGFHIS